MAFQLMIPCITVVMPFLGWAARGRQDVHIMPYNLGNHSMFFLRHASLMPFLLLLGWLMYSICVPVMILKMPFIFLFGWFVKSNRLLCMPFKSREVHGRRTVIVIFIKYVWIIRVRWCFKLQFIDFSALLPAHLQAVTRPEVPAEKSRNLSIIVKGGVIIITSKPETNKQN